MVGNITQAPIGYVGVVTLTMLDKNGMVVEERVIRNNGVNNLFLLLCNFIVGNLTGSGSATAVVQNIRNMLPKYLAIGSPLNVESTNIKMQSLQDTNEMGLQERFPLTTNGAVVVDSSGNPFVQWSCNIPYTSVVATSIKELGLHASITRGTTDMLARITTTTGTNEGITIANGRSLLVNWRMYFTNKITTATGGDE